MKIMFFLGICFFPLVSGGADIMSHTDIDTNKLSIVFKQEHSKALQHIANLVTLTEEADLLRKKIEELKKRRAVYSRFHEMMRLSNSLHENQAYIEKAMNYKKEANIELRNALIHYKKGNSTLKKIETSLKGGLKNKPYQQRKRGGATDLDFF